MTSRRRIEAALRAGPPDEPVYPGGVAEHLGTFELERRSRELSTFPPSAGQPTRAQRWVQIAAIGTAAAGIAAIALLTTGQDRSYDPVTTNPAPPAPSTPETLPEGWAVTYDSQPALFLGLADDYAANADPDPWGIRAWAEVAPAAQDPTDPANCTDAAAVEPGVDGVAAAIADWMVALPTLNATRSTMTIGGLPAEVVDAEIVEGGAVCDWGNVLIVSRTSKPDPFAYGISVGQHERIILIDVLPGRTIAMFLDDTGHPGFDALEAVAMPIVEPFLFSPKPSSD